MSNNTIWPALRAGRSALEASLRPILSQSRCFSASSSRPVGHVITFEKTSNETLDGILHEMQHKILLPSVLPLEQRKRIFRGRYKAQLEHDPIEIEVDGQRIKFRQLDWTKGEVPNTKKLLFQALDNMKTKDDWQLLPRLLEALHYNANRKLRAVDYAKIVRKAGQSGNVGPIIDAAKKPEKTGFKLDSSEKVQQLMSSIVWEAAHAGWALSATKRALRSVEHVLEIMEDDAHEIRRKKPEQMELIKHRFLLKRDPQILAMPLLLAAMLVVRHRDEEYAKKLRDYAEVIVSQWPQGKGLLELHPDEAYVDREGMWYLNEKNKFLLVGAPILKAFDLAMEGLEDSLARQIKSRRDPLAEEVRAALEAGDLKEGRGVAMYKMCFGEPAEDAAEDAPQGAISATA